MTMLNHLLSLTKRCLHLLGGMTFYWRGGALEKLNDNAKPLCVYIEITLHYLSGSS